MEFCFEKATGSDIPGIMHVMESAAASLEKDDWYITDDESFIRRIVEAQGFVAVAKDGDRIAGFLTIYCPGCSEDNLGRDLGFSDEMLMQAVHFDSAAVLPEYRGNGLQKKLIRYAMEMLRGTEYRYYFATVHPDNAASYKSLTSCGFEPRKTVLKYGSNLRCIVYREK